jgi:hypothetical protein
VIVRLLHGDCFLRMAGMDEKSVGAVLVDPPYGLEFMGKDWDKIEPGRLKQRWAGTERENLFGKVAEDDRLNHRYNQLPSIRPGRNRRCRKCGRYAFSGTPCGCDDPDWDIRAAEHAAYMQEWHAGWLGEALRVLVPGGVIKVFSATRTFHRLSAAMAQVGFADLRIEAWTYASGFPKSLDIGMALDRTVHRREYFDAIRAHLREWKDRRGFSNKAVNIAVGSCPSGSGMAGHWMSKGTSQPEIPTKDQWLKLKEALRWPDCELDELYDSVRDGAERPGTGFTKRVSIRPGIPHVDGVFGNKEYEYTMPATPEAEIWDGWGTALKPAWEPILVGRKGGRVSEQGGSS